MIYNILVLEDNLDRINEFILQFNKLIAKKYYINYHFTNNAQHAIELISKNNYNIMFLDHDLDHQIYCDTNNLNTGSEVSRFINKSEKEFKNTKIIIHTLNTPASFYMKDQILSKTDDIHLIKFVYYYDSIERIMF